MYNSIPTSPPPPYSSPPNRFPSPSSNHYQHPRVAASYTETTPLFDSERPKPNRALCVLITFLLVASLYFAASWKIQLDDALTPQSIRHRNEVWREEEQDHQQEREHWLKEEIRLKTDYERSRVEWAGKEDLLRKHYDQAKVEWAKKETSLRTEHEKLKSEWEQDNQRYRRDQAQWEAEKRKKEEERKQLGIAWDTPYGQQCSSYGTRPYNARIHNVPWYMDPVKVCAEMPIQFHGRRVEKPLWCERLNNGEVHGHWMINFDETLCQPYWTSPQDKGCIGYRTGLRRYEARLWGWYQGWGPAMCASTPNTINGHSFSAPAHCEDWGGMVGLFDVPDSNCN